MPENQEPKYLTPYVSGVDELGANTGEIGKFIAKVLKLPQNVQNVFRNFSTAEFMTDNLASSFGLDADQTAELTRILRSVLLADLFWGDFPKTVSARLQVPPDAASRIVKAITDGLLTPALEDIKTMQREKFSDRISQNQSNQAQTQPPQQNINPEHDNVINLRNQK
jgi:hypothetical protein